MRFRPAREGEGLLLTKDSIRQCGPLTPDWWGNTLLWNDTSWVSYGSAKSLTTYRLYWGVCYSGRTCEVISWGGDVDYIFKSFYYNSKFSQLVNRCYY